MSDSQPLADLLARRWSPRNYDPKPIEPLVLRSLFDAAHASFSCFNEQPWHFVVATKDQPEDYERILDCLVPQNQAWAKDAYLLGFSCGKKTFARNGSPNRYNLHDAGAALMSMAVQATENGLYVHGMGGYDAEKARALGIPEEYELGAAFAVGHLQAGIDMPPRTRKPLSEQVLKPGWVISPIAGE